MGKFTLFMDVCIFLFIRDVFHEKRIFKATATAAAVVLVVNFY